MFERPRVDRRSTVEAQRRAFGGRLAGARCLVLTLIVALVFALPGCGEASTPSAEPRLARDQKPLSLARPLFDAGYELVSYDELDTDANGVVEGLAVFTVRTTAQRAFSGGTVVLLLAQQGDGELWIQADAWELDGVNASAELFDVTGDGFLELVVVTEEADRRLGDFVTPLRHTDHMAIFTYTSDMHLDALGMFSSSVLGATHPQSTVVNWNGRLAIQTVSDLSPSGVGLWHFVRIETFVWQGGEFVSVHMDDERRISPLVLWIMRSNAPWAAAFLLLGGGLGLAVFAMVGRRGWRERWWTAGLILLVVAGGLGVSTVEKLLCVPALILLGLVGVWGGRELAKRWLVRGEPRARGG